jgi:gas vesicle protein
MSKRNDSSRNSDAMLLALLGGAALGALAVALTTPKTGREVRDTLKATVNRLLGKTSAMDDYDDALIESLFI